MKSAVKRTATLGLVLLVVGGASVASAQIPVPLTVTRNEVRGSIDLGLIGADLTLRFEDAVGLHPGALEVTATLVDPTDIDLLNRLPGLLGGSPPSLLGVVSTTLRQVTIPVAFPVLLRIAPSATSALSFAGEYSISLHTHNLQLDPNLPLALYKSHDGGPFEDIMVTEGRGSYRAGGGGGDFSEFLIVVDRRPIDTVIAGKFDALQALLTEHGDVIAPVIGTLLQQRLSLARTLYDSGATVAAIAEIRAFSRNVSAASGQDIPDVWRANCPGVANVAGLLRAAADTLRFSLDRKASR